MAFWSDTKLREELPQLIKPFHQDRIDCAAYRLAIGAEEFVSNSNPEGALIQTITKLAPTDAFTIPSGQFAFLLTEESIAVPSTAIAFISIRANLKFRGLINVSGFHVDPGYSGHLVFSVYNAGPSTIHLRRGDQQFLVWYADLDRPNTSAYARACKAQLDAALVSNIAHEFKTLDGLSKHLDTIQTTLDSPNSRR